MLSFGTDPDRLTERAYLASVIGPFRRISGKQRNTTIKATGGPIRVSSNSTGNRVLFVAVDITAPTLVFFAPTESVGPNSPAFTISAGVPLQQVLMPGESLWLLPTGNVGGAVSTVEVPF